MCNDPVIRTPASGRCGAYFSRMAIRPGISCSATEISLRPQSARVISATLYSVAVRLSVRVPIQYLKSIISKNLDMLIDSVAAAQIIAVARRSDTRANPAAARQRRTVRGRTAGHPDQRAEPDLDSLGATE